MVDVAGLEPALAAARVAGYAGFVLLCGTLMFWVLVWPSGVRHRRLVQVVVAGSALVLVSAVAEPAVRFVLEGDLAAALPRGEGTMAIARIAVLACLAGFLPDLLAAPIIGGRRVAAVTLVLLLTFTMVAPFHGRSSVVEQAAWALSGGAHLLGAAVWLGGLAALTTVIVAGEDLHRLEGALPRFTKVATASLLLLAVTGVAQTLAAGGTGTAYVLVAVAKGVGLVLMLMLAAYGRWYAQDMAFRRLRTREQAAGNPAVRRLTLVLQVELATGLALLLATSALVALRPGA